MKPERTEKAIILLGNVQEAMKAEQILKLGQFYAKMVAPPPEVRIGCDLAIEIDLVDAYGASNALKKHNIKPVDTLPLKNTQLKPLGIIKTTLIGDFLMVKGGHMKLTFNTKTGEIVNISGGGCPDIPYLALNMVGKRLDQSVKPKELGQTLCAYMLEKAYEKALQIYMEANVC
ncbi:MAG: DUF3343 domain-containing protein [Candidatus Bathyarchaeia archaeon]